jgi:2-C-methyl-D-erythritol 4-phosphate cytidylyltransferase
MKDTAAIIVAGGKGLRFGGRVRKQYLLLKGRPIIWWSVSAFEKCPSVESIVLVVPVDDLLSMRKQVTGWKFKKVKSVVSGGATRADSVRRGLSAVPSGLRYIAVHDAVRPLVRPALIEAVIQAARRRGAALAACPAKDTIKLANSHGRVLASPPRETVWLAQTPQIFKRQLLERAHRGSRRPIATDDAQLVERLGARVQLVESPAENIKVTVPMDFVIARKILEERS